MEYIKVIGFLFTVFLVFLAYRRYKKMEDQIKVLTYHLSDSAAKVEIMLDKETLKTLEREEKDALDHYNTAYNEYMAITKRGKQ